MSDTARTGWLTTATCAVCKKRGQFDKFQHPQTEWTWIHGYLPETTYGCPDCAGTPGWDRIVRLSRVKQPEGER